jgi:hypothetical protein
MGKKPTKEQKWCITCKEPIIEGDADNPGQVFVVDENGDTHHKACYDENHPVEDELSF